MGSALDTTDHGPPTTDQKLDRHDERRRAGVPTVSVLLGPIGPVLEPVRRWAWDLEREMVLVRAEQADAEGLVVAWMDRLACGRELVDSAVAWLAQRLDQPAGLLGRKLRGVTAYDVAMLLESTVPLVSETGVELAVRRLIELAAQGRRRSTPGLAPELNALLERRGRPWLRVYRAIGELVPQECLPVLLVAPTGHDRTRLEGLARLLADLAEAQPRATLGLIVEPDTFDDYLAQAPESRAKALLRGSIIRVGDTGNEARSGISKPEAGISKPESRSRNLEAGISKPESEDDPARSAAEQFIFDLLESLPETTGLFELNAALDFHFGTGRPIEVDLVARSLKLVIEIDGYYHFQEPESYRRDRRKDLELQKRGYLVLRILAADVVERLEELLETLLSAVAFCRHRQEAR
jgi:very-short-patch-repair endonuclease